MSSPEVVEVFVDWKERAARILREVASETGVSVKELKGLSRQRHIATARAEAMLRMKERLHLSSVVVGNLFCRDHTTVLSNWATAEKRRSEVLA